MPDWTHTRARADALTVPCRYCHAPKGEPCINLHEPEKKPLWHFAAHVRRISDAAKASPEPQPNDDEGELF